MKLTSALTNNFGAEGTVSEVIAEKPRQVRALPPSSSSSTTVVAPACLRKIAGGVVHPLDHTAHLVAPGCDDLQTHLPLEPSGGWLRRPCHDGGPDKALNLCPGPARHAVYASHFTRKSGSPNWLLSCRPRDHLTVTRWERRKSHHHRHPSS